MEGDGRNEHGNVYAAFVGEEKIGTIQKGRAVFERRTKGSRVVTARRNSLRWFGRSTIEETARLYDFPQETIGGAAKLLAECYARARLNAESPASTS